MPSPESPAKRMTARSITSGFVFGSGTSVTVDMFPQVLAEQNRARNGCELQGSRKRVSKSGNSAVRRACETMLKQTAQILSSRIPYRPPARADARAVQFDVSTEYKVSCKSPLGQSYKVAWDVFAVSRSLR